MCDELQKLEKFLQDTPIPVVKKKPVTFLGISKQPHFENVWSNIYAFFFDVNAEHHFNDLFLQSLLQLIKEKTKKDFYFNAPFTIDTEFGTDEKGRIDLLLSNQEDAIIIENKVYHHLGSNNLKDYWETAKQENKQGVVLSLKQIPDAIINNCNFVSITHLELLQYVLRNLPEYFPEASEKHLIFLKDFYQNILNITNPMDAKAIDFFLENITSINQIIEHRNSFVQYVISEVERAIENLNEEFDLFKNRNEEFRYYRCPGQNNLMLTVVFRGLFKNEQDIFIIVELQDELLKNKERIKGVKFEEDEKPYLRQEFYSNKGSWAHFAVEIIKPTENDIKNLSDFISNKINTSPILKIYQKLKKALVHKS